MFYAGIDAGSRAIKVVVIDSRDMSIAGQGVADQGVRQSEIAKDLFQRVLRAAHLSPEQIGKIVGTGYGRNALDWADEVVTEITCHARGVKLLHPEVRSIIDIGGQDSKMIVLDASGAVRDFVMNDRCAAGTGRFLEVVSNRLDIGLGELGAKASLATEPVSISSMCVVFAETEIIGLLATGETPENIIAGVQKSIARRIVSMAGRTIEGPVLFTGGVALIPGMDKVFAEALDYPVGISTRPQLTGAIGAAITAAKQSVKACLEEKAELLTRSPSLWRV